MYGYVDLGDVFRIKEIFTAYRHRFESDYYFIGESHDFWEIVIVLDGELGVTAGKDVFVLEKGQAVLHEPMEFHRLWSEGNSCPDIIIFSFSADMMPEYSSKILKIDNLNVPATIIIKLREFFRTKGVNIVGVKNRNDIHYQLILKELEMFIISTISQENKESGISKTVAAKNYEKIINVLENNIEKNLSVGEIADLCNMSEINLKKTLSKFSGMGVMAYFNKMKIESAQNLIKNGMTVQETANMLGFSNQNYFSTVFKRITGKSPTFYK